MRSTNRTPDGVHVLLHILDLTTGAFLGEIEVPEDAYVQLPGDGTWVVRHGDGRASSWTLA
ncbi:hypothetical protein ACFWNN_23125 [Lentzea sp. NPDC058450]|uniref:hypothetical protein n=1 Tax=Lentzea sp. NPDC058450 TaxID=3346505 RepID=UPI00364BEA9F